MAHDALHYRELAARAYAEAKGATLDNVRERALRSAAALETVAMQHEQTAKQRAEREAKVNSRDTDPAKDETPHDQLH